MLDKAIKDESKLALQSSNIIQEINACFQNGRRPNKKAENSKPYKKEKTKPSDSQPINLARTTTQSFDKNYEKTRGNCRN